MFVSVVFPWFYSVNPDKGEGRGKEVILDPMEHIHFQ